MAEIIIAVGADADGNLINLYTGPDSAAGHKALSDAIAAGTSIGYVFANPIAHTTLRYSVPVPPAEPPTVTALNPATGPAGADITVAINGTGFDAGPTVNVGTAYGLVPASITPTDLSVLFSGAMHIQYPGVLPVSVKNGDGQVSNAIDFTVT